MAAPILPVLRVKLPHMVVLDYRYLRMAGLTWMVMIQNFKKPGVSIGIGDTRDGAIEEAWKVWME